MPMTTSCSGVPRDELPSTVRRSPEKAQVTFAKAHDAAVEEYGEGRRSYQTAYAALKHAFEKVGDHWEPKAVTGPSDEQAAKGGARSAKRYPTAEGVDANASKRHLLQIARRLDIAGRSTMTKDELIGAIQKENRRVTARSRTRPSR